MEREIKQYYIEIHYKSGNSFNTYEETDNLGLEWDDLEVAKENLQRIKDYHAWYEDNHGFRLHSERNDPRIPQPDCVDKRFDTSIHLITDSGSDLMISTFWCGHFETLYWAKIKERPDPVLEFVTKQGEYK